jgi:hypothetical protein
MSDTRRCEFAWNTETWPYLRRCSLEAGHEGYVHECDVDGTGAVIERTIEVGHK